MDGGEHAAAPCCAQVGQGHILFNRHVRGRALQRVLKQAAYLPRAPVVRHKGDIAPIQRNAACIRVKFTGHRRHHEIDSSFDCEAYDCGFAVPNFAPGYAESVENDTAEAHCDTLRCTVRGRGEAVVIGCDPNTSLYFTNVHLPAVKYHIPKGHTGLDTEVFDEAD